MEEIRLNLGAGQRRLDGFLNIDIRPQFEPDIIGDVTDLSQFADGSVDEIRMDAVYEHIYPHKRQQALQEWLRVLKPDGRLVINWVPDFDAMVKLYGGVGPSPQFPTFDIEMVRRLFYGAAPKDEPSLHKDVFTTDKIVHELTEAGFVVAEVNYPVARGETLAYNICIVARKE